MCAHCLNARPQKAAQQEYINEQGPRAGEQNLAGKVQVSGMPFCVPRMVSVQACAPAVNGRLPEDRAPASAQQHLLS